MKKCLLFLMVFCILLNLPADDPPEMRAVYAAVFSINTKAGCDKIINQVLSNNINAVFVEVRGRSDAYYFPNREDDTYPNNEPRGELYTISPANLDALQYFIDRLHNANPPREVHAWCTTYNCWNRSSPPSSPNHIYNAHPEWITENKAGVTFTSDDNAPLDPGIPAVQDHLYNVFMDIVRNYDVDGFHFDYIRLFSEDSGYDPVAKAQFLKETGWNYDTDNSGGRLDEVYEAWRRDQISRLVQRVYDRTMLEKPWVEVSAFLIHFADPVEQRGQGYNWWVAHNAIDVLHPSCYSSSVSGNINNWEQYITKLKQNGDENKVPMVAAIGEYLLEPSETVQTINNLRGNARKPEGFNFFRHGTMFSGDPSAADLTFGSGGPMDDWAPIPPIPHKSEDTLAPNPPASLSVTLSEGIPKISFNRPEAASDGDMPVHYRLFRDITAPVKLHFENMIMEWWDPGSSRTTFSFEDKNVGQGTFYYSAVSYDDWNNQAVSPGGSVNVSGGDGEYIIETRTGGKNVSDYSEVSGSFFNSSSHSDAPGCTPDIGSRFSLPHDGKNDVARFTPSGISNGTYNVYATCFNYSSANAPNVTVRTNDKNGESSQLFDLTKANCGDTWALCSTMDFEGGKGHYVEFDSSTQSTSGSNDRMNPAAVRLVSTSQTPKERKPPVTEPVSGIKEVIVDSEPTALDYDDPGSSDAWLTTTWGNNYGGSARYYRSENYPMDDYAVWLADLPRAGFWAIDGYIRDTQGSLAQGVKYRFVDGRGKVRDVTTTLQTGAGGFTVNVDGVSDENAWFFNKGRVYVTLWGNATGSEMIIADALRFRFIRPEQTSTEGFTLY